MPILLVAQPSNIGLKIELLLNNKPTEKKMTETKDSNLTSVFLTSFSNAFNKNNVEGVVNVTKSYGLTGVTVYFALSAVVIAFIILSTLNQIPLVNFGLEGLGLYWLYQNKSLVFSKLINSSKE